VVEVEVAAVVEVEEVAAVEVEALLRRIGSSRLCCRAKRHQRR
jgi:hypothetical protein